MDSAIIVLEDDVMFMPHFLQGLEEIISSSLSFIRFYFLDKKRMKFVYRIRDTSFYYTLKNLNGTQGYYITPKAAKKFIEPKILGFSCRCVNGVCCAYKSG
nr:glycosyltransferase family 25 protein [Helicobacter aurati]